MREVIARLPARASEVTSVTHDNYFKYCNILLKSEVPDERSAS
jgi:hypothetical protein